MHLGIIHVKRSTQLYTPSERVRFYNGSSIFWGIILMLTVVGLFITEYLLVIERAHPIFVSEERSESRIITEQVCSRDQLC